MVLSPGSAVGFTVFSSWIVVKAIQTHPIASASVNYPQLKSWVYLKRDLRFVQCVEKAVYGLYRPFWLAMYALFQCFFMLGNYKRCISLVAFLVLMTPSLFITTNMNSTISTVLSRHVFVSGPSVVSLQNDTRPKVGDVVQVRSPACHPNRSRHMQHNKCCEGTGCCPFGIAKLGVLWFCFVCSPPVR